MVFARAFLVFSIWFSALLKIANWYIVHRKASEAEAAAASLV